MGTPAPAAVALEPDPEEAVVPDPPDEDAVVEWVVELVVAGRDEEVVSIVVVVSVGEDMGEVEPAAMVPFPAAPGLTMGVPPIVLVNVVPPEVTVVTTAVELSTAWRRQPW